MHKACQTNENTFLEAIFRIQKRSFTDSSFITYIYIQCVLVIRWQRVYELSQQRKWLWPLIFIKPPERIMKMILTRKDFSSLSLPAKTSDSFTLQFNEQITPYTNNFFVLSLSHHLCNFWSESCCHNICMCSSSFTAPFTFSLPLAFFNLFGLGRISLSPPKFFHYFSKENDFDP